MVKTTGIGCETCDGPSEGQNIDYKTTVNHKCNADRMEILKDIVAMTNGGGGYIVVGIQDDGHGRAYSWTPGQFEVSSGPFTKCVMTIPQTGLWALSPRSESCVAPMKSY